MKKILTAIASAAILTAIGAGAASAQDIIPIGNSTNTDTSLIYNSLDDNQAELAEKLSDALNQTLSISISAQELLDDPSQLDKLYADASDPGKMGLLGTFTKNGCSVNADCAFDAIGLGLVFACAGSGKDPQAWAKCVRDKDEDAYLKAVNCTWGSCPDFANLPGQKTYACNNSPEQMLAGNLWLALPKSLNQGKTEYLSVDVLSQG
ncbi:MAG: hypothetical protein F6J93_01700 [Oscillatoria sp. SIO1A7]|nr:hypothetical protein [Oscillatoria sp. SIO1A7]